MNAGISDLRAQKEFNKLSPKMKSAVRDVYTMIDKTSDPLLGKIEVLSIK